VDTWFRMANARGSVNPVTPCCAATAALIID
jgi:hypothetical protein